MVFQPYIATALLPLGKLFKFSWKHEGRYSYKQGLELYEANRKPIQKVH